MRFAEDALKMTFVVINDNEINIRYAVFGEEYLVIVCLAMRSIIFLLC